MEAAADVQAAIAAAIAVRPRFRTSSDAELLADLDAVETLGRIVDALRTRVAAEVEARSPQRSGSDGLAFRSGARSGVELIEQVARVSHREAVRRVGLGAALAPRTSLLGEELPGRWPDLAEAVVCGAVGVEAARVVVEAAQAVKPRVEPQDVELMVASLAETAASASVEELKVHAEVWAMRLDPDGPVPKEQAAHRDRGLRLSSVRRDGTARLTATLTAEHAALVRQVLDRRGIATRLVRTEAGGDEAGRSESIDPEWREADGGPSGDQLDAVREDPTPAAEGRTRTQLDYDALFDVITTGATAGAAGLDSPTSSLHEVVVTATVQDLEARAGVAFAGGILAGLSAPTVERIACEGRIRLLVTGGNAEPLHLGRSTRLFTAAQKRAIFAAAGGTCQIPGCRVTDPYLHAHHVEWWHRDGGSTDVGNGVAICSFHHHLVHATDAPLALVRHRGGWYAVPRGWRGPPDPGRRLRTGSRATTGVGARIRLEDPWQRGRMRA